MSIQCLSSGLLWAICTIALAGGTFSGGASTKNRGGAPELSGTSVRHGAPVTVATGTRITLTAHRLPVPRARVRAFLPNGERLFPKVSMTDKDGHATISIPQGLQFKLEIKIGRNIYFTDNYTAPALIKFDPFNTAPTSTDLVVNAISSETTSIILQGIDAEGDALTYEILSQPEKGTLSGIAPNLIYTPAKNVYGADSFTYKVSDGIAESAPATVSINIAAPFIISVSATDGTFTIPLKPGLSYDFTVNYDGQTVSHSADSDLTLIFPSGAGTFDVAISGTFPAIYFNNSGDKAKLLEIKQWGSIAWQTMENAFDSCSNLTVTATDKPDLSGVSNLNQMFWKCRAMTSIDVTNWDVSNVTSMVQMFRGCSNMTDYIGINTWDVSNVTTFHRMFYYNLSLKALDLSGWNTSSATDMSYMFYRDYRLTDLVGYEDWDVSKVTTFRLMFERVAQASIDLSNWNTTDALTDLRQMFSGSQVSEIKGLENLDVTNVIFADGMFNSKAFVMTTEQYDELLVNWTSEVTAPAFAEVTFDVGNVKYTPFSAAAAARASLIANNWIINDGGSAVGIDAITTTSITSPVRVSGWTSPGENAFTISTDNGAYQPVTPWGDTLWYSDVTLNPTSDVPVSIKYGDTIVESQEITWTPTLVDANTNQSVTIRKGSSLLLGSAVTTGALLEIDVDGDGVYDLSGAPTDLFPVPYTEYGTYEITTRIDGIATGFMVVDVPQIIFPESIACQVGYTREVTVGIPEGLSGISFIPHDPGNLRVELSEEPTLPGIVNLKITPLTDNGTTPVIKVVGPSEELASKEVDIFKLWSDGQDYFFIVDSFDDGSRLSTSHLVMKPMVENLTVRVRVNKVGVTFDDSTMDKYVNTNDFVYDETYDAYVLPYSMIIDGSFNQAPCHTVTAFQATNMKQSDAKIQHVSKAISINGNGILVQVTPKAVPKDSGQKFEVYLGMVNPDKLGNESLVINATLANKKTTLTFTKTDYDKSWSPDISDQSANWYDLLLAIDGDDKKVPDSSGKVAVVEVESLEVWVSELRYDADKEEWLPMTKELMPYGDIYVHDRCAVELKAKSRPTTENDDNIWPDGFPKWTGVDLTGDSGDLELAIGNVNEITVSCGNEFDAKILVKSKWQSGEGVYGVEGIDITDPETSNAGWGNLYYNGTNSAQTASFKLREASSGAGDIDGLLIPGIYSNPNTIYTDTEVGISLRETKWVMNKDAGNFFPAFGKQTVFTPNESVYEDIQISCKVHDNYDIYYDGSGDNGDDTFDPDADNFDFTDPFLTYKIGLNITIKGNEVTYFDSEYYNRGELKPYTGIMEENTVSGLMCAVGTQGGGPGFSADKVGSAANSIHSGEVTVKTFAQSRQTTLDQVRGKIVFGFNASLQGQMERLVRAHSPQPEPGSSPSGIGKWITLGTFASGAGSIAGPINAAVSIAIDTANLDGIFFCQGGLTGERSAGFIGRSVANNFSIKPDEKLVSDHTVTYETGSLGIPIPVYHYSDNVTLESPSIFGFSSGSEYKRQPGAEFMYSYAYTAVVGAVDDWFTENAYVHMMEKESGNGTVTVTGPSFESE